VPDGTADFYGWIIGGEPQKAAAFWEKRSIPYERALALMHIDTDAQIEALRIFENLGAEAAASRLRHELMARGVNAPRGISRSTRDHVAGLTARQAEVLDLLASGRTNPEIADALFLSPRTVENHVAAILMKLDVPSRELAVHAARDMGILRTP
jgi:DNA-binding NarL/FixJ family response regulator